ncbi:MAG: Mrp/NBP35 family ATP-binding protein [Bacteroidales bacterium]|jgi:ATP-binding protein involved in chromosome partitioning|nr:Mrp/NBP35 family ATP-binding protein [Bacteroidales bacterium]MCB9029234.1 Mrp/NBP35 family ATP-binding protein [Bacteroidales bacterium]HNT94473.1 Mrp/NBP35 family ATP-binding protein [Bacteroidales bacterium]HOO67565.1 Mrp/NBP35 family ATP-binding protein [Bacteroidales bacterium]HPE23473.1 Mrp/NBP35 family ATP-binding protein [Bacteroidales bacterium]
MEKNKLFEKIPMRGVKNIIVVASGKGGVGKSTVAANLAIALARNGMKTALVDADIFGPSIPTMFGLEDARPEVKSENNRELIFPIEKFGIKIISIGFFIDRSQSLIWRGPMASNAVKQLFEDTQWGEVDYMIVDFPPGTSDIQLTTVQKLNLAGAIIVTTPQEIALNDARKASSMFMNPDLKVPILGVVENMSWFTPAAHPEEHYYLFGRGGGAKLAREFDTNLLCQIPLVLEVGEAAEAGRTVFQQTNKTAVEAFETLAGQVMEAVENQKPNK